MYARPLNQPKAGVNAFVHTQSVAAAIWTVTHNLGRQVQVTLVDNDNVQMSAETVHTSINAVEIRFGGPEAGRAFII